MLEEVWTEEVWTERGWTVVLEEVWTEEVWTERGWTVVLEEVWTERGWTVVLEEVWTEGDGADRLEICRIVPVGSSEKDKNAIKKLKIRKLLKVFTFFF